MKTVVAASLALSTALFWQLESRADGSFPASGQRKCWSSLGARVACAGSGQDGDTRGGAPLALEDNGDGTIVDLNTRLVWEKLSRDGGVHDRKHTYVWDQGIDAKIAQLNTAPCFAGHCNWRLPNVKELQSIADFGRQGLAKAFSTKCVPGCTALDCSCTPPPAAPFSTGFWSSTTNVAVPTEAWQLLHVSGATVTRAKSESASVRAVSTPVCAKATLTVALAFDAAGDSAAGVTVDVDYPEAEVDIPGSGSQVPGISNLTGVAGGLFSFGDSDTQVSVGLVSLGQAIPPGPFAAIELDCLPGKLAPLIDEFACTPTVSSLLGAEIPSTCAISIKYES